jgi:putative DNA primase/helicase
VRDTRGIAETVITDAMLGAVPDNYDVYSLFQPLIDAEAQAESEGKPRGRPRKGLFTPAERLAWLAERRHKLHDMLAHKAGWLAIFYTDAAHHIVHIKLRKPDSKNFVCWKVGHHAGLFGHDLFAPFQHVANQSSNRDILITEGDFNVLQVQTLLRACGKRYAHVAAVGSASGIDTRTLDRLSPCPVILYDNDDAGRAMVEVLKQDRRMKACTTPLPHKDVDEYIRSFHGNYEAALQAVAALIHQAEVHGRVPIQVTPDITAVVDAAEEALLTMRDAPLFQRARRLVIITQSAPKPKWLDRDDDAPSIIAAQPPYLEELSTRAARWETFNERLEAWAESRPPTWFAPTLASRPGWRFPWLEGVVSAPTLCPNGRVLTTPGYDPDTGLYLLTSAADFPALPTHPTLDDAMAAFHVLNEAVHDFPWVDTPIHRSAAIAALLTLAARYAIQGNIPAFAVRSTTPGSGKGLLIDTLASIATGTPAPRFPQVREDEEERKRLFSIAMAGENCVHIDNVTVPVGSPALNMVVTARSIHDRVLGKSETPKCPWNCVLFFSGNNMGFRGDFARRVLPIDLDPRLEKPEERTGFLHADPVAWARKNRPILLTAALTILIAHAAAGRPQAHVRAFGSFEEWSRIVRAALLWIGEGDPCAGRKDITTESDPNLELLRRILTTWHTCYGTAPRTLSEVKDDLRRQAQHVGPDTTRNNWNDLLDALCACDRRSDGKTVEVRILGNKLRGWQGRVLDGKRFVSPGLDRTKTTLWQIETV